MSKNDDDSKKISSVGSSKAAGGIKATQGVTEVEKVKGASAVKGVTGVGGVGRAGAIGAMSFEQREKLLSIVSQEAEKLASQGAIPKSQKELVEAAVKMAIDGALVEDVEKKK